MPVLLGATALFAAAQWVTEYACQSLYCLGGISRGTFAYVRALERRDNAMMIETVYVFVFSAAFLIIQGLLRRSVSTRVRPHAWVVALAGGVTLCLTRWLIDFATGHWLPEGVEFCLAFVLAGALAMGVSYYRWPRR